jgi:hypothetical protein
MMTDTAPWGTAERRAHRRALAAARGEKLIGDRHCGNCGSILFDHCEARGHFPPCCPGQCRAGRPGPAVLGRLGGRPRRQR